MVMGVFVGRGMTGCTILRLILELPSYLFPLFLLRWLLIKLSRLLLLCSLSRWDFKPGKIVSLICRSSVPSFYHMGPRDQIQVTRLDGRCLYPLIYLISIYLKLHFVSSIFASQSGRT